MCTPYPKSIWNRKEIALIFKQQNEIISIIVTEFAENNRQYNLSNQSAVLHPHSSLNLFIYAFVVRKRSFKNKTKNNSKNHESI